MNELAIFSPLPPSKSGIADYSLEIGRALSNYWNITYVISDEADDVDVDITWASVERVNNWNLRDTDHIPRFYQMGNNIHHEYIFREIQKIPGVTVMHDFSMHHLMVELTLGRDDVDSYINLMEYCHGETGRRIAQHRVYDYIHHPLLEFMLSLNKQVITNSLAIVVHSQDSLRKIEQDNPDIKAHKISFPYEELGNEFLSGSRKAAQKKLNIGSNILVFASFGFVTPPKQIALALKALSKIKNEIPNFRYYLVGEVSPTINLPELLEQLGLQDNVVTTGFVSFEEFHDYLEASDIVISLRYPSAGETSAALMRAMGMSRANVVFDYASYADYPDGTVAKIPLNTYDEDNLANELTKLANDSEYRDAIAQQAKKHIIEKHRLDDTAKDITEFLHNIFKIEGF